MASFSFGFSGDDFEDDENAQVMSNDANDPSVSIEAQPPKVHRLDHLVSIRAAKPALQRYGSKTIHFAC
jgi:hypothetical protein